ncbi:plasmepsin-2 [Clonorchis sinensis]|uniref:Plasmepsin-2 n=1 Tax=Clonorchis sinensis TaxID=79923 RepID=A0A419Q9L0_CLOSI|nr:plasmepsin-2 [Clonorchis sinensis]
MGDSGKLEGEVTFGGILPGLALDTVYYQRLMEEDFWWLEVSEIKMGAETAYKRSLAASLDTGTETIIGPKDVVNSINCQLPIVERTATGVEVMCDNIHQLPNITFVFGNYGATISYKEYIKIVSL